MANIGTDITWASKTYLGIHIGTVHINLTTVGMDDFCYGFYARLINPMG